MKFQCSTASAIIFLISLLFSHQEARSDETPASTLVTCDPHALLAMTALCCGPQRSDREPLLFQSGDRGKFVNEPAPLSCTTLGGQPLVPPKGCVCCAGLHGRACCFLPTPWNPNRPRALDHWPINVEDAFTDVWFFVALVAFIVLLFSTLVLLWYCCQASFVRAAEMSHQSRHKLLTISRPQYGAISSHIVVRSTIPHQIYLLQEGSRNSSAPPI